MKRIFGVLTILLLMASCTPNQTETLVGEVEGWGNDTLFMKYRNLRGQDTYEVIYAEDGRFTYDYTGTEPVEMTFINGRDFPIRQGVVTHMPEAKTVRLMITPDSRLKLTGKVTDWGVAYKVKGTKLAESMVDLREEMLPVIIESDRVTGEIHGTDMSELDERGQYDLYMKQHGAQQQFLNAELNFALKNMDKEVAAYLLSTQPKDTLAKYAPMLSGKVRNGIFGDVISRRLGEANPTIEIEVNQ